MLPSSNAWESKITIECINEKLEPCSPSDISYIESNENFDSDSDTAVKKKKKKVVKKKMIKESKKIVKKKISIKNKNIIKKKKNILMKTSSNKPITNSDFDKNISFEEFKVSVINYNNNSDYPNIDN